MRPRPHKFELEGRRSRYGVRWQVGGKRHHKFFRTVRERDAFYNRMTDAVAAEGTSVLTVSSADISLLREIRSALGETHPMEAVRFFLAHRAPARSVVVGEAMDAYLRDIAREASEAHFRNARIVIRRFEGSFRSIQLAAVAPEHVRKWIASLPYAPVTVRNYAKHLRAFFGWARRSGFLALDLAGTLRLPTVPEVEPIVMPVDDVTAMFKEAMRTAAGREVVPFLALGFFAGVRNSSLLRMAPSDIDRVGRGLLFQGAKHKTKRRYYVQGFPDNLWAWLDTVPNAKPWGMPSSSWIKRREAIVRAAGIEYPHNGARHSFATYHLAAYGSADRTATLLTHRGTGILYRHYAGIATKGDGERYFSIVP